MPSRAPAFIYSTVMHNRRTEPTSAVVKMFDNCQTFGYPEVMTPMKRINTRELLRNFKALKALLTSGKVQHIVIDIGGDRELELSVRGAKNTGKNIADFLRSMKKPIKIRRTHIFDNLLRPR